MQRRLKIINSTKIEPDCKTNYVIDCADTLEFDGLHSVEQYVEDAINANRDTLIFVR